jgi:hypothetical protein
MDQFVRAFSVDAGKSVGKRAACVHVGVLALVHIASRGKCVPSGS